MYKQVCAQRIVAATALTEQQIGPITSNSKRPQKQTHCKSIYKLRILRGCLYGRKSTRVNDFFSTRVNFLLQFICKKLTRVKEYHGLQYERQLTFPVRRKTFCPPFIYSIITTYSTQRTKLSQCTRKRILLLDTWHNYNLITRLNQFYKDIIVIITLE